MANIHDGKPRTLSKMPRKYVKKKLQTYSVEALNSAVKQIRENKMSYRVASEKYSIPRATLFDQMKKDVITEPKRGTKTVFNKDQETEFENYVLECASRFHGITIPTIRKIAFDFAVANKLQNNFNKELKMAGMDWYYNFIARHPNISLRRPKATSLNRVTAFNKQETDLFFRNLQELMTKYKFGPDTIFNVDETGISNVQRNSRILAKKGQKQVGKCTSAERGSLTTVVNAVSASRIYIPPFFIFKRKRMSELLMKNSNSNMVATISDSGWINEEIFVDWLHHFKSFVKSSSDAPVLLILDNHQSHISLNAYEICRKNGIHMLSLPPHTSHRMQPLDLTFYGPLKSAYNKECEAYMVNHPGSKITVYDIVGLFTKAFNRTANIDKAVNGFRAAGILPFNPQKFEDQFINLTHNHDITDPMPSEDQQSVFQERLVRSSDVNETTINSTNHDSPNVSLREIVNLPILEVNTSNRRQKKQHSEVLTSTPMKDKLEAKQQKKIDKITKQKENEPPKKKPKKALKKTKPNKKTLKNLYFESNQQEREEFLCIFCDEKYVEPITEDWIMCLTCKKWAHEKCSSGSSSTGYVCDFCRKK